MHRRTSALLGVSAWLVITAAVAAGPKAYVGNFKDATVSVIDTETRKVVATVPVVAGPHGMAVTPDGSTVYVSGDASSEVSVIDASTDRAASRIEVGKAPHGLAMTPDGRMLLAAVYGDDRIALVDTSTRAVVGSVTVGKPHTIAVRPDGAVAYVASQEPGKFALVVVDLAAKSVARTVALDKPPRDLEFTPDGGALYFTIAGVNAVHVLDPRSDKVIAQVPTGVSPHLATLFRGAPGATAVVQGPGEVLLFDPTTHATLRTIAVGKQPHWIAGAPGGKQVYVTNEGSNDVTVVDLATGETTSVPVGNAPRKVVVQPAAAKTSAAGTNVSIVNFRFAPVRVEVVPGDTVTWKNDDGAPHGIAFGDGARGVDVLLPGDSFGRRYDAAGTYDYVCAVHPYMKGTIVVQAH